MVRFEFADAPFEGSCCLLEVCRRSFDLLLDDLLAHFFVDGADVAEVGEFFVGLGVLEMVCVGVRNEKKCLEGMGVMISIYFCITESKTLG